MKLPLIYHESKKEFIDNEMCLAKNRPLFELKFLELSLFPSEQSCLKVHSQNKITKPEMMKQLYLRNLHGSSSSDCNSQCRDLPFTSISLLQWKSRNFCRSKAVLVRKKEGKSRIFISNIKLAILASLPVYSLFRHQVHHLVKTQPVSQNSNARRESHPFWIHFKYL